MACETSKFEMSYKCVVGPMKINFLGLMIIIAIMSGECEVSVKGGNFQEV